MAVPRDIRHLVGKAEWTASLGTTDPVAAAARRGELTAFCKNEVLRLRGQLAQKPVKDALRLLDRGFERLATIRDSMDKAIAEQLALLASTVIDSWLPADQLGHPQSWGGMTVWEAAGDPEPVPSIDTEPEREIFRVRAALLEGTGKTDSILYRRLAALNPSATPVPSLQPRRKRPSRAAGSCFPTRAFTPSRSLPDPPTRTHGRLPHPPARKPPFGSSRTSSVSASPRRHEAIRRR